MRVVADQHLPPDMRSVRAAAKDMSCCPARERTLWRADICFYRPSSFIYIEIHDTPAPPVRHG